MTKSGLGINGPTPRARPIFRSALPPDTLQYLSASVKKHCKRYRKAFKRCQEKFSSAAVHESRVETRRLLAMIELLRPFLTARDVKKVQAALKQHLDTFDDLRDTQVQLLAANKLRGLFPAANPFYSYLRKREERFSRLTRKSIKRIRTGRVGALLSACRKEIHHWGQGRLLSSANELLLRTVGTAFERTRQLQRQIDAGDTDTIHRTRVAFKRFRYMIETLANYAPLRDKNLPKRMHDYQTLMGDIQDAEVLQRTLDKYLRKKKKAPNSSRLLQKEVLRRRRQLIEVYLHAADELFQFWAEPRTATARAQLSKPTEEPKNSAKSKQNGTPELQRRRAARFPAELREFER